MTMWQVTSPPSKCPACGAMNFPGQIVLIKESENIYSCEDCFIHIMVGDETEGDVDESASNTCPHCDCIVEMQISGREEWCPNCQLDPNKEDYSSEDLAHLWPKNTAIHKIMASGALNKHKKIFKFVKEECGPKCDASDVCEMTIFTMRNCASEDLPETKAFNKSFKNLNKSAGKHGEVLKKAKAFKKKDHKKQVTVEFSSSGWYAKKLECKTNETNYPQKHIHRESGSGA